MRKNTKFSCFILSICFFAGVFTGCKKSENKIKSETYATVSVRQNEYIVSAGKSDYLVVIPYDATEFEVYAAKELVSLVKESTGAELSVVSDSGKSFSENAKYISVGNTSLLDESGVVLYDDVIKNYGARIATRGNSIFLYGNSERYGIIFSVYKFLYYTVGFEAYTFGVYDIQKNSSLNMYDLDIVQSPANGLLITTDQQDYAEALRMGMGVKGQVEYHVKSVGHNLPVLIYPGTYKSEHPDWFAKGSELDQLCLSNEEMWDELAKNIFKICMLPENRAATLMQLSMGDGGGYCHCDKCTEIIESHDGIVSATAIPMLNAVGDKVDTLLKAAGDERTMQYNFLCYKDFDEPPVRKNENGEYEPIDETCLLKDNRYVYFAPMSVEFCNRLDDKNSNVNKIELEKFKGWQAISKQTAFYGYGTNFEDYFFGFNDWGAIQSIAREMKNLNVDYANWDGIGQAHILNELQTYLTKSILENPEQDVNALIKKFCDFYYKDASDAIMEYYEMLRAHYAYLQKELGTNTTCYCVYSSKEWPYSIIRKMESILNKAFEVIKKYEETDPKLYSSLYNRVNRETLTYRYATLLWYWGYYSRNQRIEMIDSFEEDCALYGITAWRNESYGRLDRRIAEFRGNLSVG